MAKPPPAEMPASFIDVSIAGLRRAALGRTLSRNHMSACVRIVRLLRAEEMPKRRPLEIVDKSGLTDADWSAIGKARQAYADGGSEGLWKLLDDLLKDDPVCYATVVRAFFPVLMSGATGDEMAEPRITADELRELLRKLESRGKPR